MPTSEEFESFLTAFFRIFTQTTFDGRSFVDYLQVAPADATGDEARVVDTAIISPILGLLGFEPAERVYNQQRQEDRPDFAPRDNVYGTCFVVEDKNTFTDFNLNLARPDSHLSQLSRYIRSTGVKLGWLCNGRRLMVYSFIDPSDPAPIIDIDIPAAIAEWIGSNPPSLSGQVRKSLQDLFDISRKDIFSSFLHLEREIAIDLESWQGQALTLGTAPDGTRSDGKNESLLVEALQSLVGELQRDARRTLDQHLRRYSDYKRKADKLSDDAGTPALEELLRKRTDISTVILDRSGIAFEAGERSEIETIFERIEHDATSFVGPEGVLSAILAVINKARERLYGSKTRAGKPISDLKAISATLPRATNEYLTSVFSWHQRQVTLRQRYQADIGVRDDYTVWKALIKETMLGELTEPQRLDEFALQAAYVVFIRMLLIRVCEDKGIFPDRFLSDGGLLHWQDDIRRYLRFANGNPYSPLLDMAYSNAQNIYAHFFTGRELFNWYRLDQQKLVLTMHQLSRFNFAGVDSDIIGTIYNTYVSRKEKREKGQYYTPPEIVTHILDSVAYRAELGIVGPSKRLIDPACGSGSFLVAAVRRLVDAYRGGREQVEHPMEVLSRVQSQLYGFDLNPFACYLAEVNLLIQVLDLVKLAHDRNERPQLERFHIYNVDSLARPRGRYRYALFNTQQAEEDDIVDQIKSRAAESPYVNGFAFVVGNPPYGAKLSDTYKERLRQEWEDVFYGQPDTYVFFTKLGVELLAQDGHLGFIIPNTILNGTNTKRLREVILDSCRVTRVVDLPQGIWEDATVDCVLLFLAAEPDAAARQAGRVTVNLLDVRDSLADLANEQWVETLEQSQSEWADDPRRDFNIRFDALLRRIEQSCQVEAENGSTKVLRLDDITESTQGIIIYQTAEDSRANLYIKPAREVPQDEPEWKPLLHGDSSIGRYWLAWDINQPYLKYGDWLCRPREAKFFNSPKILLIRLRNKSLKRRLVGTYDNSGFYNSDNFNNIIAKDENYDLKYVLALFNSSVLNYWYKRKFDNVNVNPESFRQLPIYPAGRPIQDEIVALINELLAKNLELSVWRNQGYRVEYGADGEKVIEVPYDILLDKIKAGDPTFTTLDLYDAEANGLISFPEQSDRTATVSGNVRQSPRNPEAIVLRHNRLLVIVGEERLRRYLLSYLKRPQWKNLPYTELQARAVIPDTPARLDLFFQEEGEEVGAITELMNDITRIDSEIDERVLDLYGIREPEDRRRVMGDSPTLEEVMETGPEEQNLEGADAGEIPVQHPSRDN